MDEAAGTGIRIVYSRRYNIRAFGLEKLHPFDSQKYGRAFRRLKRQFGARLRKMWVRPPRAIKRDELLRIHTAEYLDRLADSEYVAGALEIPQAASLPGRVLDWCVLRPMRWGTMGTIVAAREAMANGLAINLSGGYHHAKPDGGEGFCIYADIPLAIEQLRRDRLLDDADRVVCIDLDAHQGNGHSHCFRDDRRVFLLDMYNPRIYPAYDTAARERIDCDVPLPARCGDEAYLSLLKAKLPAFLDSVCSASSPRLAIYNAGTDIYEHDLLGGLSVSAEGIIERDRFVIGELLRHRIPCAMVLSGGYHRDSYRMIAASVARIMEQAGGRSEC
jgi:histone deacetylase 11